ncbi:hypothetical protein H6768_04480 [Candidatus Peribacteria bacterium]|nr:hypothetical protein [Candidatus Peribacteria bacterium]
MRFRLLASDGAEIDSRQIRVTRTFMAQTIDTNNITGVTPSKTSQTFNLSKEDKSRLDKLSILVKSISDEETKTNLIRYVDQL